MTKFADDPLFIEAAPDDARLRAAVAALWDDIYGDGGPSDLVEADVHRPVIAAVLREARRILAVLDAAREFDRGADLDAAREANRRLAASLSARDI